MQLSIDGIEGVQPGQHVLLGTSAQELAEAVLRLAYDPDLRQQMGNANRHLIETRYTWSAVADRYETLYRAILAAHHH